MLPTSDKSDDDDDDVVVVVVVVVDTILIFLQSIVVGSDPGGFGLWLDQVKPICFEICICILYLGQDLKYSICY